MTWHYLTHAAQVLISKARLGSVLTDPSLFVESTHALGHPCRQARRLEALSSMASIFSGCWLRERFAASTATCKAFDTICCSKCYCTYQKYILQYIIHYDTYIYLLSFFCNSRYSQLQPDWNHMKSYEIIICSCSQPLAQGFSAIWLSRCPSATGTGDMNPVLRGWDCELFRLCLTWPQRPLIFDEVSSLKAQGVIGNCDASSHCEVSTAQASKNTVSQVEKKWKNKSSASKWQSNKLRIAQVLQTKLKTRSVRCKVRSCTSQNRGAVGIWACKRLTRPDKTSLGSWQLKAMAGSWWLGSWLVKQPRQKCLLPECSNQVTRNYPLHRQSRENMVSKRTPSEPWTLVICTNAKCLRRVSNPTSAHVPQLHAIAPTISGLWVFTFFGSSWMASLPIWHNCAISIISSAVEIPAIERANHSSSSTCACSSS